MELKSSEKLESQVIGCSLSTHWWGINKKAGVDALNAVANHLGTNQKYLKIEKRLINHRNIHYKALCETRGHLVSFWKDMTLPYVEPGVRLIRKDNVSKFESKMEVFKIELSEKILDLSNNYEQLKEESKRALKNLYNEQDYPDNINDLFSFYWEYPNLSPPEYLLLYNPELYKRQQLAIKAKFEEAVQKAEKAFGGELQDLVTRLTERMAPNPDGSRKIFRDSTVTENFKAFFKKFREISVSNSADLNDIIRQAESIMDGVNPEFLKTDSLAREDLARKMNTISTLLESKIGIQPRRSILRTAPVLGVGSPETAGV
jgi:hypothetical protein